MKAIRDLKVTQSNLSLKCTKTSLLVNKPINWVRQIYEKDEIKFLCHGDVGLMSEVSINKKEGFSITIFEV